MISRYWVISALVFLMLPQACAHPGLRQELRRNVPSAKTGEPAPQILAVYEPWFGHPRHISVGYSSHDPVVIHKQIDEAKALGISGFVVDWYGDREPFLDRSYALIQTIAAEKHFQVAMMYDESDDEEAEATDDAFAAFNKFNETYLSADAPGRAAYLTYNGRPVIFIFPKGGHTDWNRVRAATDKWAHPPLLIYEDHPSPFAADFDGFYAWINPGKKVGQKMAATGEKIIWAISIAKCRRNIQTRSRWEAPGPDSTTAKLRGVWTGTFLSAAGKPLQTR